MVYVDELRYCPKTTRWPYGEACHLVADTLEELHAFATKIQLRRAWFQDHDRWPHYDLTAKRRSVAIQHGAMEIRARDWILARRIYPCLRVGITGTTGVRYQLTA